MQKKHTKNPTSHLNDKNAHQTRKRITQLIKEHLQKTLQLTLCLMEKRRNAFSLGLGTIKDVSSHHSYLTVLEVLAGTIRPENEIKGIQIKREEIKLALFADCLHKKSQGSYKQNKTKQNKNPNPHRINKCIQEGLRIQSKHTKSIVFLYANNE